MIMHTTKELTSGIGNEALVTAALDVEEDAKHA